MPEEILVFSFKRAFSSIAVVYSHYPGDVSNILEKVISIQNLIPVLCTVNLRGNSNILMISLELLSTPQYQIVMKLLWP